MVQYGPFVFSIPVVYGCLLVKLLALALGHLPW